MKKFTLALCAALMLACGARAQEVTLEGLTDRGFTGARSINGEYYYTLYFGEKTENKGMANFVLALYDKDMQPVKTTNLEITKNSELAASSFSGKYFLFIFTDINKKTRSLFILDKEGNIVKQKTEEDVRRALLTADNFPDVHILGEEDFLLVRAEKDKKFGYEIERMDATLTSKWVKTYLPEKGIWSIEDSKLANGRLYLLRKEKPNALWGDKFNYAVQGINLDNGDITYTTELSQEDDMGFPSFIRVTNNGTVATGGMYFKDGKYDEKNSDGFFFALINADGTMNKFTKSTWKKVKDQVQGDWLNEFFGGKTRVLVEDVLVKKDGTYMIIGETFRKSDDPDNTGSGTEGRLRKLGALSGGGSSSSSSENSDDRGFTVMDFLFINFDANGEFAGISKVEKPSKEAVIKGSLAKESALAMAQSLAKRKYFCYREVIEVNDKQYIMYKNEDGFKSKAYFLPVGQESVTGIGSIDMDKWVSEGLNKLGKLTGGNKHTITDPEPFTNSNPELYKNILPAKAGHVLLYQFSNGKMSMWLQPIPAI